MSTFYSDEELFEIEARDFVRSFGIIVKRLRFQEKIENGTGTVLTSSNKITFDTCGIEASKEVYEWLPHVGGLVTLANKSKNQNGGDVFKVSVNLFRYGAANWNYGFIAYIEELEVGRYRYVISLASAPKLFELQNTLCVESTILSKEVIMSELEKLDDMYPAVLDYFRKGLEETDSFLGIDPDPSKKMLP